MLRADTETAWEENTPAFAFVRIKGKFGNLRADFDLDGSSDHFIDIHDEEGGLETVVDQADGLDHMKRLPELVEAAMQTSASACMVCVAPGKARVIGCWCSKPCDADAAARLKSGH